MSKKTIKNNVVWSTYLFRTELKEFQWDLKLKNDKEIVKLAERMKRKWFDDPIKIWYDNDNYILDWHQRLKALNLLQTKWYMFADDKVPVVFIKADTLEEAKEKVFEYNAKYSAIDSEFAKMWWDWLDLWDLEIPWMKSFDDLVEDLEPDNKDEDNKDKPFVIKITSKTWRATLEKLFQEIEPALWKYEWLIDYSFSWWEL